MSDEFDKELARRDFEKALSNLKESKPGKALSSEDVRNLKSWLDKELDGVIVDRR